MCPLKFWYVAIAGINAKIEAQLHHTMPDQIPHDRK